MLKRQQVPSVSSECKIGSCSVICRQPTDRKEGTTTTLRFNKNLPLLSSIPLQKLFVFGALWKYTLHAGKKGELELSSTPPPPTLLLCTISSFKPNHPPFLCYLCGFNVAHTNLVDDCQDRWCSVCGTEAETRLRGTDSSSVMGCCSVTQRHTGVDEVGPDELELLELSGDNLGVWSLGETRLQLSVRSSRDEQPPPPRRPSVQHLEQKVVLWGKTQDELHHRIYSQQPIRGWEGQPAHMYGEIIHSSPVSLYITYTQETCEYFLVLFSFHLLILSLDHSLQDFIYEGILPLSGLSFQVVSLDPDASHSPHMFEISSPVVDSKVFICASAAELQKWMQHAEDRRHKSMMQPMSPAHCALSYLLPCDEHWKREELKKYLLQAPIWQWEGSPIQHMGQPAYVSLVYIINTQRQGFQERLMVLFPQDVLLLSVDNQRLNITYEGRLPRQSIKAMERSALPGRLEFELIGELVEPLQVSCTCLDDYQNWIFHLQQPDRSSHVTVSHPPPPIMPKLQRNRKESQEPMLAADQYHISGRG